MLATAHERGLRNDPPVICTGDAIFTYFYVYIRTSLHAFISTFIPFATTPRSHCAVALPPTPHAPSTGAVHTFRYTPPIARVHVYM